MLQVGSVIDGKYKILNEIGHGGMSVVYLALNERANKTWAIKEVRKNGSTSFEVVKQGLIAETNILKKLNHPHLPSIVDVIDQDDSFLVVMDYIEGVSLAKLLKNSGAQPWQDVVEWGKQLCDVLAYLHSRRPPIIYRDMKPDNVQLRPDGQVMLLDFGTAREFKYRGAEGSDTTCLGTRGYAAPEQYGGMGETDGRTDIFCLGATMYHLLTGHNPSLPPYEMKPIREINPNLPMGLEMVILKCTQQDPAKRYQNCVELMYDLEHFSEIDEENVKRQRRKVKLCAASAALALTFGIAALGTRLGYNSRSSSQYEHLLSEGDKLAAAVEYEGDSFYQQSETNYTEAIKLQPNTVNAYLSLASLYGGKDASVSMNEVESINRLLASNNLEQKCRQYPEFAFSWGAYLYFYYTPSQNGGIGEGRPQMAEGYLQTVSDEKTRPSDVDEKEEKGAAKKRLASIMYHIAQGERMLNSNDKLNASYTYADYWEDLDALLNESTQVGENGKNTLLTAVDNGTGNPTYFALSLYKSIINALNENRVQFNAAGKSRSTIMEEIDKVELAQKNLYTEYKTAIDNDQANKEIYDYITGQITIARDNVNAMNG